MNWLTDRRKQIGMSQDDLAIALTNLGFNITRSSISHWETGRYDLPLEDPNFRQSLSDILEMTVDEVLFLSGYELGGMTKNYSQEAILAAEMIDKAPPDKRRALLEVLEKVLQVV